MLRDKAIDYIKQRIVKLNALLEEEEFLAKYVHEHGDEMATIIVDDDDCHAWVVDDHIFYLDNLRYEKIDATTNNRCYWLFIKMMYLESHR